MVMGMQMGREVSMRGRMLACSEMGMGMGIDYGVEGREMRVGSCNLAAMEMCQGA